MLKKLLKQRKCCKIINEKFEELKLNLENNYKDLAHDALREYISLVEAFKEDLPPRKYEELHNIGMDYKEQLKDYHH